MPTKAELELRVAELEYEVEMRKAQVVDLSQTVVTVALKYAKRHNWCKQVRKALTEAGLGEFLPPPPTTYVVQVKDSTYYRKWTNYDTPVKTLAAARQDSRDAVLYWPDRVARIVKIDNGVRTIVK